MGISIITKDSPFVAAMQASAFLDKNGGTGPLLSGDRAQALLADAAQLSRMCMTCFWASLEREERREVRGTLSICSPHPFLLARSLRQQVPVTVPNLVALLTASPRTPLAVHGGPEGLHVWGMLDGEPEGLVHLRIAGSGTLLASCSGKVLSLFHQGVMTNPLAADTYSLGKLLAFNLGKERFMEIHGDMPDRIIRMVSAMIRHGHGGTLVLVEPGDQSWLEAVRFKFAFDDESSQLLQKSIKNYEIRMNQTLFSPDHAAAGPTKEAPLHAMQAKCESANYLKELNASMIHRVGELSLIDGAVVMDMEMKLYGFGAKLEFGPEEFQVIALNAVTGVLRQGLSLDELGGMRHQSAARFVHGNRSADVFVVSQDGRLSLFCWSDRLNGVAMVHNLEHFIWEYESA